MIVVTGATGKLGRQIVERLLDLIPPTGVGASVRDPEKADNLARRGVRVRQGDFGRPDTLASAFEGAAQLLMISSNAQASGGHQLAQHRAAITAAATARVRRIVYTSHMGAGATSAFSPMHGHAATEDMLRESGLAWTALRNGFYASTVPRAVADAVSTGVVEVPADGKVAWTAHDDLAAAAARILVDEGRFDGPTPPLTASEALDFADVAAILSELHGRPIIRQVVSAHNFAERLCRAGLPGTAIDIMLGMYRAAEDEEFSAVDPALADLIGYRPTTLRDVLNRGSDG